MRSVSAKPWLVGVLLGACFNPPASDDTGGPATATATASTDGPGASSGPAAAASTQDDPGTTASPTTSTAPDPTATTTPDPAELPPCGNGELALDEECDDGNTRSGDGCDASCAREEFYIFATAMQTPGDFGTVKLMDDHCRTVAAAIPGRHPHVYVALLSASDESAVDRVKDSGGRLYVQWKTRVPVATNTQSLLAGDFLNPVAYTEDGTMLNGPGDCGDTDALVWTGTGIGGVVEANCGDWGNTIMTGRVGAATASGIAGLSLCSPACASSARIYCVENP